MRVLLIAFILLTPGFCYCLPSDTLGKYDISIWTGYHYSLGYLGMKFEYAAPFWERRFHIGAGVGISKVQPRCMISTRIDLNRSSPFRFGIGCDLVTAIKTNILLADNGETVVVGSHSYWNPYLEISLLISRLPFYLKIETGYSFLLNPVNISPSNISPDQYNSIRRVIDSDYMIGIGLVGNIEQFHFKKGL